MPRLEAAMSSSESEKLALQFARTKWFVPTRSHPGAPTFSTLAEGLTGLLVAPIDKLRDLMRDFPDVEGKGTEVDWLGMLTGKPYSLKGEEGKWEAAAKAGSEV